MVLFTFANFKPTHMRSSITLFMLLLSVSLSSFSQDSTFEIKEYKYRTKGYRALDLQGELGGAYHNRKTNYQPGQDASSGEFYFGPISASYFQTYNLDRRIHSLSAWVSSGF